MKREYQLIITEKIYKEIDRLPKRDQQKILASLARLIHDPFIGKKLEGQFLGYYSLRIWSYRVLYSINNVAVTVTVIRIGHRKNVYQ